jgi:hypothetical protein
MKRMRICAVWGILAVVGLLALASDARADGAWPYGSACYLYHYYPQVLPAAQSGLRDVPYYAAHPPVYYSHIVARPYGYSPQAYYPGIVTPDFEMSSPWHPYQPMQPYWDGGAWRWRIQDPGSSAAEPKTDGARPNAAPKAPQTPKASPATIRNEYFPDNVTGGPQVDRLAPAPLRIINPYVVQTASSQTADPEAVGAGR